MAARKPTPERLGAFSDGVIAIVITIMVLELKPPHDASLHAILNLWPTFLSYALSYLFVGVFWANHHHLLRYAEWAEPLLIWSNLLVLFFVSLIPFFTAYISATSFSSLAAALYAGNFLLVTAAFMLLQNVIAKQFGTDAVLKAMDKAARKRNWIAFGAYAAAIPAAYLQPLVSLAIVFCIAALYFIPDALKRT